MDARNGLALTSLSFVLWGLGGSSQATERMQQAGLQGQAKAIQSRVTKTAAGERVLTQEVLVDAPIAKVWAAYTTAEGWTGWAAPVAKVELKNGGTIRTNYRSGAKIGDADTNTLHIVNYVPQRILTLRAELQRNWPEVMKQDAGNLMNVIVFEPVGAKRTKIHSYGCGYGTSKEYAKLMGFFTRANEGLFAKLKAYLEQGKRAHRER